ncbi:MAG: protein-disulfide reductase DsbD family protein [Fibrobacterota bacterium]
MKTAVSLLPLFLITLIYSPSAQMPTFSLQADKSEYAPNDTVILGVKAIIPDNYHLYSNPLGPGIGKPFLLTAEENENIRWVEARKSAPLKYQPPFGDWVWAYKKEACFFLKGVVTAESGSVKGTITMDGLVCQNSCIPVGKTLEFSVPVKPDADSPRSFGGKSELGKQLKSSEKMDFRVGGEPKGQPDIFSESPDLFEESENAENQSVEEVQWAYSPLEEKKSFNLLTALLFSFLAGLALNITPCIFPMLGIRVLSFAQGAGESRRRAVFRSIIFSLGIVAVFLILASLAAFAGFSWGQQFQNPRIMMLIIALVFLFALGMFDFYTILVPSGVSNLERKGSGLTGEFLKGAVATVLATPCGGPFLGALLAWALLQSPAVIFLIFTMIGIGMALPYVLLSSSRRILALLPKPGKWMEDFKHVMGFFLLAFAVHLMTGLSSELVVSTVGICLSLAFAAGVNKRFAPFGTALEKRVAVGVIALALAAAGVFASVKYLPAHASSPTSAVAVKSETDWQEFAPEALKAAHEEKRNVVLNFTAAWCTSCHVNKATVLESSEAESLYDEKGVVLMTADLTHPNEAAQSLLHHLGSRSVPFLAIFPADSPREPIIMRDNLNKKKFVSALEKLP